MAVAVMSPSKPAPARTPRASTPQEIITTARNAPAGARGALLASGLSGLLLWGAFTPVDFGPLAWISLIPLIALVRLERPVRRMYLAIYVGGLAFWLAALQWMRLGHPVMYAAWGALALYLAVFFPLFVGLTRVAVWRLRVPLTLAVPIVWVGLELFRGYFLTGFGWYYLAHTQYRWIELIQISDVLGAYGVSFLIALVAGCAAELLPESLLARLRMLPFTPGSVGVRTISRPGAYLRVAGCLAVFAAVLTYGYARRSGVEFQPGPRVALIQGNETSEVKHDPRDWGKIQRRHEVLTGMAVKEQPDLIVWPETMFRYPLFEAPLNVSDEQLLAAHPGFPIDVFRNFKVRERLANLSQMANASLVIGLETVEIDPHQVRTYNSAVLVGSDGVLSGRYDKLHRVVFGEYIPLVETFPWLQKLTPFGEHFGISAGTKAAVFDVEGFRFAPIICFEDTVPQLVRNVINATTVETPAGPKPVDFLVNLTNDGWFHGSSELDQHLITAAFRCVEFRTPMVRAVNTGISAFIDGDGVIRRKALGLSTGEPKQEEAVLVDTVPLDDRQSLYLVAGDWFGGTCLACCGFVSLMGLFGRWLPGRKPVRS
jgi:apolipoprotein N-acyltransferase